MGGGGRLGVSGDGGKRVEREIQIKCRSQGMHIVEVDE